MVHHKVRLAVVTVAALAIAALSPVGVANAVTADSVDDPIAVIQAEYEGLDPDEIVEQGLEDEGFVVEEAVIESSGIEIEAASAEPESNFRFDLRLEPGVPYGEVTFTDVVNDETVSETYDIEIAESTAERAVFTLTNPATGESYTHDTNEAVTSIAFVIPVAFAAVSLSTALYYLAIGAAIVIGGVLALEAAKAVSNIIAENNRRPASQKRDYYPASRSGSKVFISPSRLSSAQAQTRGRAGGDVWAISRDKAKFLAKVLNRSGNPVGAEKHGAGYLWHFHPYRHTPNMHSFYGLPS